MCYMMFGSAQVISSSEKSREGLIVLSVGQCLNGAWLVMLGDAEGTR